MFKWTADAALRYLLVREAQSDFIFLFLNVFVKRYQQFVLPCVLLTQDNCLSIISAWVLVFWCTGFLSLVYHSQKIYEKVWQILGSNPKQGIFLTVFLKSVVCISFYIVERPVIRRWEYFILLLLGVSTCIFGNNYDCIFNFSKIFFVV